MATLKLEEYLKENELNVDYVPSWKPSALLEQELVERGGEFIFTPMSAAKQRYILQDVKRLTDKFSLAIKWPIDKDPCWDLPHFVYFSAKRDGLAKEFMFEVLKARWGEGKDVCAEETILEIVNKLGLGQNYISLAMTDKDIRQQALDALYQGYRDDAFGVPFFIHGFKKFWGTNNFDDFIASVEADQIIA